MQKNVKIIFWVMLLCAGGFLAAWNLRLVLSDRPEVLLVLSPENVEMQTPFTEGAEFQAELTLENKTQSDLVVKKIMSSCVCTGLCTKEGEPIESPMVLSPSKPFSILATVDTHDMEGKRGISVMALYEYQGQPLYSAANISFEVIPQEDTDLPK